MSFLPFSRPAIGDEEIAAVTQVLKSGWITTGPKNQELEQLFCQTFGCKHAIAVSSATAGMHVTLMALNIGPGDEVITPSQTWVSTINLITLLGATPVFVDVDRDTLMTDATRIAKAITPRTKAIIPVHYAGAPADLDPIYALAAQHQIMVGGRCCTCRWHALPRTLDWSTRHRHFFLSCYQKHDLCRRRASHH